MSRASFVNPFLLLRGKPLTFLHSPQCSYVHALEPASDGLTKALGKLQACVCFQSLSFAEQLGCLILVFHMRSVIFAEFMLDLELGCTGAGQFSLLRVVRTSFAHSCGVEEQHRYS